MPASKLAQRISLAAAAVLLGATATAGAAAVVSERSLGNQINLAEASLDTKLANYMSQAAGLRGDVLDAGLINISGYGDYVVHGALGVDNVVTLETLSGGLESDFVYMYFGDGGDVPSGFYTPVWYVDRADGALVGWVDLLDRTGRVVGSFDTELRYEGDDPVAQRIKLSAGIEYDPSTGQTTIYIDIHWTKGSAKAKIGG